MPNILVVDDDPITLMMVEAALQDAGHQVVTAADATAAIERLRGQPDLLVSDLFLPDGDGVDLCRRATRAGVRALMMTGGRDQADRLPYTVLLKPFQPEQLQAVVAASLAEPPPAS